ncbi:MAG: hypothetical protein LQ346_003507 [Caloplaca aetnensis]|nr:MAG: hypothetical protein LQ346_003507 [Caloplaca aetnensis]
MASRDRQQPHWQPPTPPGPDDQVKLPPLTIWNTLTHTKTPFVPLDWRNNRVTWYACGPTVYDDAHLGHARNYISTDILRRILKDFFKFNVKFVMNITDIDDKIILRARQQHLLEEFKDPKRTRENDSVEDTNAKALAYYVQKNLDRIPAHSIARDIPQLVQSCYAPELRGESIEPGDTVAKIKMHINTVLRAAAAITEAGSSPKQFDPAVEDILLPYLDSKYGGTIDATDYSIFTKLTKKFEDRFMEDVRALNCEDPDVVTRVTEYSQQIVDFVNSVLTKGYAYKTSDGSVYFNIKAYEAAGNEYARLEPWSRNDTGLMSGGEGSLTKTSSEKRSEADFALWKASRPGEPSWPSPWGNGRPGWHIECSAMASEQFGGHMDIHSGGIDLAFPHHDNELVQSEAYWCGEAHSGQHQWVNYFMHMGHLSIQGSKMSKSLKNFTTIREALSRGIWTSRGLRILFLLGGWREGIEISDNIVKEGSAWEDKVNNFFIKMNDIIDNNDEIKRPEDSELASQQPNVPPVSRFSDTLAQAKENVYNALCDSFDTPQAMQIISELITEYNSADKKSITTEQTLEVARWVTSIVNLFGLNGSAKPDDGSIGWSGIGVPEHAKPYLVAISRSRDTLRQQARTSDRLLTRQLKGIVTPAEKGSPSATPEAAPYQEVLSKFQNDVASLEDSERLSKDILQLCDRVRDVDLWDLGIYLEDRADDLPAIIRPVTKELRTTRTEQAAKEEQKRIAKAERDKEAAARADKGKLSHHDMFRTTEYSAWDEEGLPLKDQDGNEITKSKSKKLKKDWERQKKLHEAWQKANTH